MTFFSDERAAELRELFFECSDELLQELNEAGILLESNPADSSALARVRRAMHTFKGDAAACGFQQLSELAHHLEDLFTADLVAARGRFVAEIVLSAADTFHAMLGAYRGNLQPPDVSELRAHIRRLTDNSDFSPLQSPLLAQAVWSTEERARITDALRDGNTVYHLTLWMDSSLSMPAAALQLATRAIEQCGAVLSKCPDGRHPLESLTQIDAAIVSSQSPEWIRGRCAVPGVVAEVSLQLLSAVDAARSDALQVLLEAEARAESANAPADQGALDSSPDNATVLNSTGISSAEAWLRVEASRVDTVMNLLGELIIGKSMLHRAVAEFERRFPKDILRNRLGDALSFQSRVLNELQKSIMKIRMVPLEQLFRRLPRIVRDVAKSCNKEITIEMAGQNTDLDKSVLDALAEPLAHLVRNAADHGIETPEERLLCGKSAMGTIRLDAYHQGNQVVIEVGDDGRGINREYLVRRAIEIEMLTEVEALRLSDAEALQLIFRPGLSTAKEVTNISGRGVGMDVVLNIVDRLKGKILVESEPGRGTTFQIIMPLTLASIQALMFRVGAQCYAVPLDAVLEIARTKENEIRQIDGQEVLRLRDHVMSAVRLGQLFEHETGPHLQKARHFVVVISAGDKRIALVVDSLVGEEELVIKSLEDRLVASELVSGASILGDGTVVLILNILAVVAYLSKRRIARMSA